MEFGTEMAESPQNISVLSNTNPQDDPVVEPDDLFSCSSEEVS